MTLIRYLRSRNRLTTVNLPEDEIASKAIRAGGECQCDECGKLFLEHPYIENCLSFDGEPFLHLICDGRIVKL